MASGDNPYTLMLHIKELDNVDDEVKTIIAMMFDEFDFRPFDRALGDVAALFQGEYPGYRACNTCYHDMVHTLDVLLATVRLLHGVHLEKYPLTPHEVNLTLLSAVMHDVGYIQEADDLEGTGAKHTLTHVRRSIDFMEKHFIERNSGEAGLSREDFEDCRAIVLCTDLAVDLADVDFRSERVQTLGHVLGTADLVGQMADDIYLEKLTDLWDEFEEGGVQGFESEYDLTQKTLGFYKFMQFRLENLLGNVQRYMAAHFKVRFGVDRNLYEEYTRKNIEFLADALAQCGGDYGAKFKRSKFRNREFLKSFFSDCDEE